MNELDIMYLNALSYLNAYNILAERFTPNIDFDDIPNISPVVINGAFAIELILKFIIKSFNEDTNVRDYNHNISKMVKDIKEEYKINIFEYLKQSEYEEKEIWDELQALDNICISWRYVFQKEARSINLSFFSDLLNKLEELMQLTHNNLKVTVK